MKRWIIAWFVLCSLGCDRVEVRKAIPVIMDRAEQLASGKPLFVLPAGPENSSAGYQLILDYEVGGGESYYSRFLSRPTWPGASSGVTVGVGYDCGYVAAAVIREDWKGLPIPWWTYQLGSFSGIKGREAKALVPHYQDIVIAWPYAEDVFQRVTIARYWQLTRRTYPGVEKLCPEAQWALLSLVYNRGGALEGSRRVEMKRIRELVPSQDYTAIARNIREMKRLWKGTDIERGMNRRRDAEAAMLETCGGRPLSSWMQYRRDKARWRLYPVMYCSIDQRGQYIAALEIRGSVVF